MDIWVFKCYKSAAGRDKVFDWYQSLSSSAQAEFDVALEWLGQRERPEWTRPAFDMMGGKKYRELGEIRFKASGVPHRVFGYFGPERLQFCLLLGATKNGKKYDPADALDTAVGRMNEVKNDKRRANDRQF